MSFFALGQFDSGYSFQLLFQLNFPIRCCFFHHKYYQIEFCCHKAAFQETERLLTSLQGKSPKYMEEVSIHFLAQSSKNHSV
jgi:hypothetical protein